MRRSFGGRPRRETSLIRALGDRACAMGRVVSRAVIVSFLLSEIEEAEWIRGWGQDVVKMDDGTGWDESSRWDAE